MDIFSYFQFWLYGISGRRRFFTQKLESIYDINIGALKQNQIKLLVFDVDDTIGEHKGIIPIKTIGIFTKLKNEGFIIALLSNCSIKRRAELIKTFSQYNIYISPTSVKPNPSAYLNVCNRFNIRPENSAMFGEKIGSDMFGAFLAGYKERVLVKPYTTVFGGKQSSILERAIRFLENISLY